MTDGAAVRAHQQKTWATGDFHRIGVEQLIVGELLCEAVDIRPGERVLDVACGAGNTALAVARRRAHCVGTDFVPALLERADRRALAEGLEVEWVEADAHQLPFADASFDVVLSTFGVMFAAEPERAAAELLRVVHPGGKIGLANWTPASVVGEMFRLNANFIPPLPGMRPATEWGTGPGVRGLLGDRVTSLRLTDGTWRTRFASFQDWLDVFRTWFGPPTRPSRPSTSGARPSTQRGCGRSSSDTIAPPMGPSWLPTST